MGTVNAALDAAQSIGANVVRTWAFLDGGNIKSADYNGYWMQQSYANNADPTINYDWNGLKHLDDVVFAAKQRGMKLILSFTDNWRSFGGIDQYVSWWGLDKHDYFFTNTNVKLSFKRWVSTVINRVNYNTGITYANEPTIFAWELINEPRCGGGGLFWSSGSCTAQTITNWVSEMSTFVRSLDPNHLIGIGDEGFFNRAGTSSDWTYNGNPGGTEGGDFDANIDLPNINFGTFHVYPDSWGKDPSSTWVTQWINDHAAVSIAKNKPVILEEFGWWDSSTRASYFTQWTNTIYSSGLAGSNFWMLGTSGAPYDGYTIFLPDGSGAASVIQTHGSNMQAKNTCT